MEQLANVLERFNRKERNLLIRDILDKPLHLGSDFCERLAKAVGIPKESVDRAWWATDFHFDWLAGALLTFMKGETQNRQDNVSRHQSHSRLVMGNQEDLDLVVVAYVPAATMPYHLILIEAKAYGHFTSDQYQSKVSRLELLYAFYKELERESQHKISFHYVLYSPAKPTKLVPLPLPWQSNVATVPEHIHLELMLPKSPILTVARCDDKGALDIKGDFWRCVKLPATAFPQQEDASSEVSSFLSADAPADGQ
jgi:hypothetical protein